MVCPSKPAGPSGPVPRAHASPVARVAQPPRGRRSARKRPTLISLSSHAGVAEGSVQRRRPEARVMPPTWNTTAPRRDRRRHVAWAIASVVLSGCPAQSAPATQPAPSPQETAPTAKKGPSSPSKAQDPPQAAEPPPAQSYKRTRQMMGTIISITTLGVPESQAATAVDAAFEEMQRLEAVLSEWRADSEISRINDAAGGPPVKVGPDTLKVVKAGLDVSRWSEGAFDLSWAAMRGLYTFQPGEEHIPDMAEVQARLSLIDYEDIVLDEQASTVQLKRKGMKIGTGGIAKGYALDRAADLLKRAGIESFMFFGGGQVQVHGLKVDRPWRVGIQHPRRNDYFASLEATSGSISTSGDYEHAFIKDGKRWHHIVDPQTGLPVGHTSSVTVLSESGLYADALSTAVFVLGPERALARLSQAPGRPQVVIVDHEMELHLSPGTEGRVKLHTQLVDGRIP